jgi:predicted RNA binding protein YcfA (HicA-like mRNA interferase family)
LFGFPSTIIAMLLLLVFATLALLILFTVGVLFPTKVFLSPTATRERVMKFYGIPAVVGFIALMALAPANKGTPDSEKAKGERSAAAPEQGRLQLVRFNGMALPGRMTDAKATGFTECAADYYGYTCRRTVPTQLLGLTAQTAELTLDGKDHFANAYFTPEKHSGDVRKLPAEELAYGTIMLTFSRSSYDEKCVDKHQEKAGSYSQPASCITDKNSIGQLNQALLDGGWVLTRTKGGYLNYVHSQELVEVTTKDETVTVRRVSAGTVKDLVARDAEKRASKETVEANAANVIEQIKR